LAGERVMLGLRDGEFLKGGAPAERVLRRMAHLILSLPEAQLGERCSATLPSIVAGS
jgi:hypothetical protein